jgi:hypothetical protein
LETERTKRCQENKIVKTREERRRPTWFTEEVQEEEDIAKER